MSIIDLKRFHAAYFAESLQGLDAMESDLLLIEKGAGDPELMNAVFRAVHSVKGTGGSLGFDAIAGFSHHLESVLDDMRKGVLQPDAPMIDVILDSVDCLRSMIHAEQEGMDVSPQRAAQLREALVRAKRGASAMDATQAGGKEDAPGWMDDDLPAVAGASGIFVPPAQAETAEAPAVPSTTGAWGAPAMLPPGTARFYIDFKPHRDFFRSGNDPLRLFRVLAAMGTLDVEARTSELPDAGDFDPAQCYLAWRLTLTTSTPRAEVADVFDWVSDSCDLEIREAGAPHTEPVAAPADAAPAPGPTAVASEVSAIPVYRPRRGERRREPRREEDANTADAISAAEIAAGDLTASRARSSTLQVNTERVDDLINLVGELVITQTMLKQIGTQFEASRMEQLEAALAQLERNTRDLQERVMAIRMLPVNFAFGRFPRTVRDIAQQLGKQVELVISGEQSELDKTVIEKLIDPLTHLVRNALDHGIETPAQRAAVGKPDSARLALHAEHKSGNILITVRDDGRGIDLEKVRARAVEQGLIDTAAALSPAQLTELIFMPGFSTASEVSGLSGRGVGLDVVRRNINELGGSVQVSSQAGQGSEFTIRLPLTLAIVDGMSIAVGNEIYIVPMTYIVECLQPAPGALKSVAARNRVVEVRERFVPVVELSTLCGVACLLPETQRILLLLEADGRCIALQVDALIGQYQVVIKSLESHYRKVQFMSGATILGDGRVALILDVNALVRAAAQ